MKILLPALIALLCCRCARPAPPPAAMTPGSDARASEAPGGEGVAPPSTWWPENHETPPRRVDPGAPLPEPAPVPDPLPRWPAPEAPVPEPPAADRQEPDRTDPVPDPPESPAPPENTGPVEPKGCVNRTTPGQHVFRACSGQLALTTVIPADCAAGGCGLIFDVHGYTMSADSQNAGTRLRTLVEQDGGYILVQPSDPNRNWDPADGADGHVIAAVKLVRDAFQVDRRRIHFTGFSQGGWMSWRMACAHPDVFASVAPVAGGDTTMGPGAGGSKGDCFGRGKTNPEIPILHLHGTADRTVSFRSAESIRSKVVAAMGNPAAEKLTDGRSRWTGNGMHYELLTHSGGHCIQCMSNFRTGEEILKFFKAHPAP